MEISTLFQSLKELGSRLAPARRPRRAVRRMQSAADMGKSEVTPLASSAASPERDTTAPQLARLAARRAERSQRIADAQDVPMPQRAVATARGVVTASAPAAAPSHSTPSRLHFDVPLLLITITLIVFGLLMAYSASADFSFATQEGDATYIFRRQVMFLGLGVIAALVAAWLDYHHWQKIAVLAMAAAIAALIFVLFIGDERNGAVRTLFGGSVQPSELAKVVMVLYLAVWLYAKRDTLHDVSFGLVPLGVILGFVGGLIYIQPDLSAVLTIILMGGVLFFLAGGDLKQIAIVLLLAVVVGGLVVASGGLTGTGQERMKSFWEGWQNPLNASYHVQRSIEAFVKGGLFGVGIGNADTKFTGLPVPHTDSIFAVVGEETGMLGAAMLVILYSLLLWRGLTIAQRAPDGLGRLLAGGLSIWLVMEAFINMAVMVGLIPFAGNALPFISVGGSNLMMSLVSIGIILNVSRLSERTAEAEERNFSEVVDLRRGTGGGVYPAISVHSALAAMPGNVQTQWVGGEGGMEAALVSRAGIPFKAIPAAGVHGVGVRALPGNLLRLACGIGVARRIVRQFQPDVLLFTGGYVAVPMALAARLPGLSRRPKSLLYVPDIEPGWALKVLAQMADQIAVTAEDSRSFLPRRVPLTVSGYPVRRDLKAWDASQARATLGLKSDLPVLLVTCGSKGARSINRAVIVALPELLAEMEVIQISGDLDWPEVQAARTSLKAEQSARYHAYPYLHQEMGAALTVADLVVSRAGASTLGEYPLFGLPAVLVPYPFAWRYQRVNADYLATRRAAVVLENAELAEKLLPTVRDLMGDSARRQQMRQAMRALDHPQAAETLAGRLRSLAGEGA